MRRADTCERIELQKEHLLDVSKNKIIDVNNVAHIINEKKPKYVVQRYLYQNNMLECNRKFEDFVDQRLIRESNGFFHFIAKCNTVFTATLKNN